MEKIGQNKPNGKVKTNQCIHQLTGRVLRLRNDEAQTVRMLEKVVSQIDFGFCTFTSLHKKGTGSVCSGEMNCRELGQFGIIDQDFSNNICLKVLIETVFSSILTLTHTFAPACWCV